MKYEIHSDDVLRTLAHKMVSELTEMSYSINYIRKLMTWGGLIYATELLGDDRLGEFKEVWFQFLNRWTDEYHIDIYCRLKKLGRVRSYSDASDYFDFLPNFDQALFALSELIQGETSFCRWRNSLLDNRKKK
jgi:hypothetical protein